MAQWRAVEKGISTSARFVSMDEWEQLLFLQMLVHADDFGLLSGNPMNIKLQCCPASTRSLDEIRDALAKMASEETNLIVWYEQDGQPVVSIREWDEKQPKVLIGRRTKPKFPVITDSSVLLPVNSSKFQQFPRNSSPDRDRDRDRDRDKTNSSLTTFESLSDSGSQTRDNIDHAGIMEAWNETFADESLVAKVARMSDKRRKHIKARVRQMKEQDKRDWTTADPWRRLFEYLRDKCEGWWKEWGRFTFDWLVKSEDNLQKAVEGHYEQKNTQRQLSKIDLSYYEDDSDSDKDFNFD